MLAELRDALAGGDADAFRRAAHSLKSNSNTFGALHARRAGARARARRPRRRPARRRAARRAGGRIRARRRGAGGAAPCAELRTAPARLLVADDNKVNRLLLTRSLELQGHSVACAENGRVALEMLRREPLRPAAARHGDAGDGRLPGARAADRRPAAARPAGDRHLVARRHRQRRALHRARRRGLPAQAGQPGAAEGAHRREPREEAPARPAEGAGAPLRHLARSRRTCSSRASRWAASACTRIGDVLRHPRLHRAGRSRSRPRRRSSCSTPTTR